MIAIIKAIKAMIFPGVTTDIHRVISHAIMSTICGIV
jgi:hypothetical protein